ncbi:TauD/TfdA family dioxygenase [uncultured Tateyamaria sp.]|uniref:TauD/TfdA dioxygenase family protein n=1 Tax=uncultured Tateyamaria sp. TaxID=455651 RepID=UPI002629DDC8|nr:TauD/TfdA family dioxygenase [uncultured Tateyamaria sp.]
MRTSPLTDRFGVELHDIDLSTINAKTYASVRRAFEQHSALLFRNQTIDDDAHMRLARLFGPIEDRTADERDEGEAFKVPQVSNLRADGTVTEELDLHTLHLKANMLWHADSTFLPTPALANILIGRVVTETGGATELASTRAGWADMPDRLRNRIRDKGLWHRYAHSRARISPELAALPMFHKWPDQLWRAVWRNPVTQDDALYIASHAFAVDGMEAKAGAQLIDELIGWVTQPPYVYTHHWQVGDVLIWDQRAVLHRGTPWNYKKPRVLSSICVSATTSDGVDAMRLIV